MPFFGKTLPIITLVGGLFLAVTVYLEMTTLTSTRGELVTTQTNLTAAEKAKKDALAAADKAKGEAKDATTRADAADSKAKSLESDLATTKTTVDELKRTIADNAAKLAAAEAEAQKIKDSFNGMTPEQIKADMQSKTEAIAALTGEKRILEDKLAAANLTVGRVEDALRKREKGNVQLQGVSGRIVSVNRTWNFVVLNVGHLDGVVGNGVLIVSRGKDFVGKVRVVTTEAHTAVADILPEWTKGDIQAGDDVIN